MHSLNSGEFIVGVILNLSSLSYHLDMLCALFSASLGEETITYTQSLISVAAYSSQYPGKKSLKKSLDSLRQQRNQMEFKSA